MLYRRLTAKTRGLSDFFFLLHSQTRCWKGLAAHVRLAVSHVAFFTEHLTLARDGRAEDGGTGASLPRAVNKGSLACVWGDTQANPLLKEHSRPRQSGTVPGHFIYFLFFGGRIIKSGFQNEFQTAQSVSAGHTITHRRSCSLVGFFRAERPGGSWESRTSI